jgi:hypothetical protein
MREGSEEATDTMKEAFKKDGRELYSFKNILDYGEDSQS